MNASRRSPEKSDVILSDAITTALRRNILVPPGSVTATVSEGRVVLTGTVDHERQRHSARRTAAAVPGVRSCTDQINVRHENLTARVAKAINATAGTDVAEHVWVEHSHDDVVLHGWVRNLDEERLVRHGAERAAGLHPVKSFLSLRK